MANFYDRIAAAAERFPDRVAIERIGAAGLETTSYRALVDDAGRVAEWLDQVGVTPGDRVAILGDNSARWIAVYLGILRHGGVAVPLDTTYKPAQVQAILADSGARVLFADRGSYLFSTDPASPVPGLGAVLVPRPSAGTPGSVENRYDPAVILYTSGTTADPKGVVLSHGNLDAERIGALRIVQADEHDVILGVLPLFHALAQMANLLLPLSIGARVVFLEAVSSTSLLAALDSRGVTIFACVPQFFYLIHQRVLAEVGRGGRVSRAAFQLIVALNVRLRDHLGWNPGRRVFARVHRTLGSSMRVLITGGSRVDPGIARDLYGMGFTLLNAYGLTETSGGATIARPGDRFTTSVGQPFEGVDIRIAPRPATPSPDDDENDDGEVLIRGPIVMQGYFNRPDATAAALVDGWLYTGDLGRVDTDGRLYITGRKKEIIVLSSGKNLYPEEIEAHYRQSPFVKELCVLGLTRPGEPAAERLHGVIVPDDAALRERGVVNIGELIRFELEGLAVQLPAHKRILSYDIVLEPLPRTSTGKLRRHEIERQARERASRPPDAARTLSDDERAWLADSPHARAIAAIAERLGQPTIAPHANLELDLGLDSMERVELLTWLEGRAGTQVPADVRATIFTVRQLVEAVAASPAAATARAGSRVAGSDSRADVASPDAGMAWDRLLGDAPDPSLAAELVRPKAIRSFVLFLLVRAIAMVLRLFVRVRVRGRTHWPARGAAILTPNHQSYLDGFVVAAALPFSVFRRLFFVGAAEYFETPLRKWAAREVNIVPVDPDANLVSAMRAGAAGLALGKVLMLFPEGERSIDGTLRPFRKGAAILAAHTGAPMVPVAIDGLFAVWPRGRRFNWRALLPWRGSRVTIAVGQGIDVPRGAHTEATAALQSAVARLAVGADAPGQGAA